MPDRELPEGIHSEKIGIMGGTFDPIHLGHLLLAEAAREEAGLDRILFVPTGISYLKEGRDVSDREDRYRMTALAIKDHPSFFLSRIETDRPGKTYTADTLRELDEQYPGNTWYLIVGADSLMMMDSWIRPEEIFSRANILCAARGDDDQIKLSEKCRFLRDRFGAECRVLSLSRFDLSSSEIRDRIRGGKSVRYQVSDSVFEYIKEHRLYQERTVM
ncbi:MAG: nicotinate-nucleotide adenylyltransferase [Lachnospiraceae bacterium]|nr:nicotinate-nucleotide adenylyltransferase [Lachnospiraceae bacterium]